MAALMHQAYLPEISRMPFELGPLGPFPHTPLHNVLERRWLHYAFLSRDNTLGMVANISWLGPASIQMNESIHRMPILLIHERGRGWQASQFNAESETALWSAFRFPHAMGHPQLFTLKSVAGSPAVTLTMQRSSRPCTSQCAPFSDRQYLRWQSESGVIASGDWEIEDRLYKNVEAVGYHERVRGTWGWPEMGGWVFGFANDPSQQAPPQKRGSSQKSAPPPTAVVFTLIQPPAPPDAVTGSVMLWQDGRLRRHFPRRNIQVAVRGQLDRDCVCQVPELSNLFGVPPMAPIPRRLMITAQMGPDWVVLDFTCESAARVVIPNETGITPYTVHEVIGPCCIEGQCNGRAFGFETYGIVEFAGGANQD
ncbi:MAG: hypothetical protein AAGL17_00855 [Cyanobacteria bacterium J06576_12]